MQDEVTEPRFRFVPRRAGEALKATPQATPPRPSPATWPRPRGTAEDLHFRRLHATRLGLR